jgi:hypothetical protein
MRWVVIERMMHRPTEVGLKDLVPVNMIKSIQCFMASWP